MAKIHLDETSRNQSLFAGHIQSSSLVYYNPRPAIYMRGRYAAGRENNPLSAIIPTLQIHSASTWGAVFTKTKSNIFHHPSSATPPTRKGKPKMHFVIRNVKHGPNFRYDPSNFSFSQVWKLKKHSYFYHQPCIARRLGLLAGLWVRPGQASGRLDIWSDCCDLVRAS